jgi:cytochrome c biogenesis protein CcmG/thiol:disulfide interchange protein DsbE
MNRSLFLTTIALLLCIAASAKPSRGLQDANRTGSSGPEKGATAPDFTLKVVDGKGETMQLSSLQGKAVLVNFWATWCEPCKIEMPWLAELQKKYGPEGLQIIGVAMDDSGEKTISDFAHKMGVNYPVLQGTEKVADMYGGAEGLPTSFFIDRSGKVSDKIVGLVSESVIEDAIKKSLEQKGDTKTAAAK